MRFQIVRTDCTVSAKKRVVDPSWRTWAYEQAQAAGVRTDGKVVVVVQATAKDARSVPEVVGCLPAVEMVLDGLKAGGAIRDNRHELVELRVRQPIVTGVDGMMVDVADVHEPW